jgi:hypothetical protein
MLSSMPPLSPPVCPNIQTTSKLIPSFAALGEAWSNREKEYRPWSMIHA